MSVWAKMQRYADGGMVDKEPEPEDNSAFVAGETGGRDLASASGVPTAFRAPPNAPRMPAQNLMQSIGTGQQNVGNIREQLQKYLDLQNSGIADLQKLVEQHHGALDRQGQQRNLAPLLQLADDNFGGHLSKSYKAPHNEVDRDLEKIKSQDLLNKERQPITQDVLRQDAIENSSLNKAQTAYYNALRGGVKATNDQNHSFAQTAQLLESARGNQAAQQAEKDIYATNKIDSLVNQGNISPTMLNLLASEVGKIATGGVPTVTELQGLKQNTIPSALASAAQVFLNEPVDAHAMEFVKQLQQYSNAIRGDAQKLITDRYGRIIETHKRTLHPNDYGTLQEQYINRFIHPERQASNVNGKHPGIQEEMKKRGLKK